jgi:hypothetical protein
LLHDVPDHTTAAGAARLAERIAAYWREQDSANRVRVWLEPIWDGGPYPRKAGGVRMHSDLAVRSNLIGGLPPAGSTLADP